VTVSVHSVVSNVHPIVVRLLASCVGVDRQSWVFALSALCFIVLSYMGHRLKLSYFLMPNVTDLEKKSV
jgi:hypothetical protein